jgi:hypothetical protein
MGIWESILLILKYFPIVVDLVKKLNEQAENAVIDFRVNKAQKRIDYVFASNLPDKDKAKELNDVFRK